MKRSILPIALLALLAPQLDNPTPVTHAQDRAQNVGLNYNPAQSLAPLVEKMAPAVVNLAVSTGPSQMDPKALEYYRRFGITPRLSENQGSGFLISADGYILTNHHVIEDATSITIRMADEREFEAQVVGSDPRIDVGLVKIDTRERLPFVSLGPSESLRVGDWVVAIGNPFGLSHTVTQGIVSAKGRSIGAGPYDDFIQTDASINPGNSGGPLFDLSGRVIGINTAVSSVGQGIGFAVPSDMVLEVLEDLKNRGRVDRGWIGVGLRDLDSSQLASLGLQTLSAAVVFSEVYPSSPAARAGARIGDIVTRIDGRPVADSGELVRMIGSKRAGQSVRLSVLRDGSERTLTVTLAARPDETRLKR
ncbi:MAG: trypsin-like peptidase domain-containing protein [Myxococcota bacterium]|nr:trypsin-like peptidase domain-containing protein [Myxococcota bacterium]